jgi:Zn-dependent M28 family amino/carboxypeptidase
MRAQLHLAILGVSMLGVSPTYGVQPPPERDPGVESVIDAISPDNLRATIEQLVSFGTRHTLSETESEDRGIGAARRWLRDELQKIADASGRDDITVELMTHIQPPTQRVPQETEIVNVIMIIPGTSEAAKGNSCVVLGHYDSRAAGTNDAKADAPGANDDGSGTALVLELARVFAQPGNECEATTIFLMTAGEEQGLLGAHWFARHAVDNGWNIVAGLSNDIVGDPTNPEGSVDRARIRLFSEAIPRNATAEELSRIRSLGMENDSPSRQLARYVKDIAERYETAVQPWVIYRTDRFLRGGDHTALNEQGFAAVRFTEVEEAYDRQHQDVIERDGRPYGDVAEFVDAEYLAGVTALNGAVLYSLANAPSAPLNARLITAGLRNDTTMRWDASPEPDVAGYEVVYRDTTAPFWEHVIDVGAANEHTIDVSKDNYFFGVRAYDADGHRSLISFTGAGGR